MIKKKNHTKSASEKKRMKATDFEKYKTSKPKITAKNSTSVKSAIGKIEI